MDGVVSALSAGLTAATFWDVIGDLVPFIVVIVPVALGLTFLRRLIKGASHAKVKI